MWPTAWLLAFALSRTALAKDPPGFADGHDLQSFVTRPELRAPRYVVKKHKPIDKIAPGYWFVAHYPSLFDADPSFRNEHIPAQTGPHIYDNDGELVWSGALEYENRNVFDFKPVTINGTSHLSFFIGGWKPDGVHSEDKLLAAGVVLNNRYQEIKRIHQSEGRWFDVHQFTVLPNGKSAILSVTHPDDVDAASIGQKSRVVLIYGFQEVEYDTGKLIFDWDPLKVGIGLNESCDTTGINNLEEPLWDYFHLNSVDKFSNGDYLISGRHTSTVYRVDGTTGEIIWRLGGPLSDFKMTDDLPFYWQHHVSIRSETKTHTVISIFDNHGEDIDRNLDLPQGQSVGKLVVLDKVHMKASVLRSFPRPDGGRSSKLGSIHTIGDDIHKANVFIDWGDSGFISEYTPDGTLVMEARLQSNRMYTYRAYKHEYIGNPVEAPVLKVLPVASGEEVASSFYVSWNGATEVAYWTFYGGNGNESGPFEKLATVKRNGFETSYVHPGQFKYAFAEAFHSAGISLGRSGTYEIDPIDEERFEVLSHAESAEPAETAETLQQGESNPGVASQRVINTAAFVVVDGLALFGLYSVARSFMSEWKRRRGGYVAVDRGFSQD